MTHCNDSITKRLAYLLPFILLLSLYSNKAIAQENTTDTTHAVNYYLNNKAKRPIPYPVIPNPLFEQAVKNGTRTNNGRPGPNYWMNSASYHINATLSPASKKLRGNENIEYTNNSPDTLKQLVIELRQNYYKAGNIRDRNVKLTGGIHLSSVDINGNPVIETNSRSQSGYYINGTIMHIRLNSTLVPGASVQLHFTWIFKVPPPHESRMGQNGKVFYLGYWYPQMSVYDDIHGWDTDQYMGDGEFYMDYADYDVNITLPDGWLVGATGTLRNPHKVLTPSVLKRLSKVTQTDSVVHVVTKDERGAGKATLKSANGKLTWHYTAKNVRDFAFGASSDFLWDASTADVGNNKKCTINSFYRPGNPGWNLSNKFCRFTIQDMSKLFMSYPWPNMTVMDGTGIIGGGMEYPMITLIGFNGHSTKNYKRELFYFIYHETGHMWFPMQVGSNEKAYAWMDEGLTTFNTNKGVEDYFPKSDPYNPSNNSFAARFESTYYGIAGSGYEMPSMRHSDRYPPSGPSRTIASYSKPAAALHALEGIMGKKKFREAYREYAKEWAFKHPMPYDFFNTFDRVYGKKLDWFWTSMFYNTWTINQSISKVTKTNNGVVVTVKDLGLVPMPVFLRATYKNGMTANQTIPVDVWLEGNRTAKATFMNGNIVKVEIDPNYYLPDINRKNNIWTKPKSK
ncbi:MAG TPA: M1 family metallopeptidase [Balneolales bacterium]|nr:M1 family metallopeptidase [Balneolales bacterium]